MTPLQLDPGGLPGGWADVAPGDAVVAFSRKSIYKARKAIEKATGHQTCIVYGALPAETRRAQARLFNDPASGANILIASDAIGLGLNFNIRRIIFTTLSKAGYRGRGRVRVPVSLVKQIAGRAGRRNSIYPEGCVTTLDPSDLPTLKAALDVPASKLYTPAAGLAPEYETVELLSSQFPNLSLEQLLKKLDAEAKLDGRYFLCNQEQLLDTARVLGRVKGLSLADQFTLVNAPIDASDDRQREAFLAFTRLYAAGQPVLLNDELMPAAPPDNEVQMADAESLHKILGLWLWLSFRFEEGTFPGRERVQAMAKKLSHWLNIGLQNIQRHSPVEQKIRSITAAAAAVEEAAQQQQQLLEGGGAGSPDSVAATEAEAEAEAVDSSDADEVNDSVFTTPVIEIPAAEAAAAEWPGSSHGAGDTDAALCTTQEKQGRQQHATPPKQRYVAYINWGSSIISSGLSSTAGSGSSSEGDAEHSNLQPSPATAEQLLSEAHYLAAGSASVEVLEQLMMPEFDPSMAPFVRWRGRPRFVVPPRPRRPQQVAAALVLMQQQQQVLAHEAG